ncbi:hypothetical protein [Spirulina major]|uniref:hypothetical protein n=1 Tax=Spirulina major TaxID=270636 RepID=UPI0009349C0D|nr:hypothetical protein [Spirulina major]
MVTATEAQLLLKYGLIQDAQDVLRQTVPQLQQHAENWAGKLLRDERLELNTAERFATPLFKPHISAERVDRIVQISPSDQSLFADRAPQTHETRHQIATSSSLLWIGNSPHLSIASFVINPCCASRRQCR